MSTEDFERKKKILAYEMGKLEGTHKAIKDGISSLVALSKVQEEQFKLVKKTFVELHQHG